MFSIQGSEDKENTTEISEKKSLKRNTSHRLITSADIIREKREEKEEKEKNLKEKEERK